MLHENRVWCVAPVADAAELARKLTEYTWCSCNGFELGGYLWLNDSTSADGVQEYAVVKRSGPHAQMLQLESITFGWCTYERALAHIERTLSGEDDGNDFAVPVSPRLQTPKEHGRCHHCA